MSFKRATWTSGYTYVRRCEYCGTVINYTDRQLDYRPWYTNGFIYCPRCRKPLRHNEIFAVHPDGSPVFSTQAEADSFIRIGYYQSIGISCPPEQNGTPPQYAPPEQNGTPPQYAPPAQNVGRCVRCGREYVVGRDLFCPGCGTKHGE